MHARRALVMIAPLAAMAALTTACGTAEQAAQLPSTEQATRQGLISVISTYTIAQAAKVTIAKDLSCQVKPVSATGASPVSCTGTTTDGKPVALTGTINKVTGADRLDGDFAATVAGRQIFNKTCIGVGC